MDLPWITAAWLCFIPIRVQMVCRQTWWMKTLSCCTRAKVPFALEAGTCFPSRALRHDPAIHGWYPAVFSLHRLTLRWFQPTVVAAKASQVFMNTCRHRCIPKTPMIFFLVSHCFRWNASQTGVGWVHVSSQIVKPWCDICPENLSRQLLFMFCVQAYLSARSTASPRPDESRFWAKLQFYT